MLDVEVIDDAAAAAAALDPVRSRLLAALTRPASAAALASVVGLPRQKIHYHLRTLEGHGLIRQVGERRWGGLTERLFASTANSYLVSPKALGEAASDPDKASDRLSAGYLIALAARLIRELGELSRRASEANRRLATLSVDTDIRFRNARERAAFADEVRAFVTSVAARYHDPSAPGGRWHRFVVAAHPMPSIPTTKEPS